MEIQALRDSGLVQVIITCLAVYAAWSFREGVKDIKGALKDLYDKYGGLDRRVARVETVQEVNGCDQPTAREAA